jgi:hypothetical protein
LLCYLCVLIGLVREKLVLILNMWLVTTGGKGVVFNLRSKIYCPQPLGVNERLVTIARM